MRWRQGHDEMQNMTLAFHMTVTIRNMRLTWAGQVGVPTEWSPGGCCRWPLDTGGDRGKTSCETMSAVIIATLHEVLTISWIFFCSVHYFKTLFLIFTTLWRVPIFLLEMRMLTSKDTQIINGPARVCQSPKYSTVCIFSLVNDHKLNFPCWFFNRGFFFDSFRQDLSTGPGCFQHWDFQ